MLLTNRQTAFPDFMRERIFINLLNKPDPEPVEHIKPAADNNVRGLFHDG